MNYATDFCIDVHELGDDGLLQHARFTSRARFTRERVSTPRHVQDGVLLADEQFIVRAMPFAHHDIVSGWGSPTEESTHINVWRNRLEELRLPSGPWLTELKRLARSSAADDTPVKVRWRTREGHREETLRLGDLKREVLRVRARPKALLHHGRERRRDESKEHRRVRALARTSCSSRP